MLTEMSPFGRSLVEVMRAAGYVQKDAKNEFHKYRYASAEAVQSAVRKMFVECGLYIKDATSNLVAYKEGTDAKGRQVHNAVVRVNLIVTDGTQEVMWSAHGEGQDSGDKSVMKANTAAIKYAIAAGLLISWGDDPEADPDTDVGASATPPPKATKADKPAKAPGSRSGAISASAATLLAGVASAGNLEALEGLRNEIKALRETDRVGYTELVSAFKEREGELRNG